MKIVRVMLRTNFKNAVLRKMHLKFYIRIILFVANVSIFLVALPDKVVILYPTIRIFKCSSQECYWKSQWIKKEQFLTYANLNCPVAGASTCCLQCARTYSSIILCKFFFIFRRINLQKCFFRTLYFKYLK